MKCKDGFILRPLGKEFILTAEGKQLVDFNKIISMNQTCAYLWQELSGKDFCLEDMLKLITDKYEVEADTARADLEKLLVQWKETGIVED